MEYKLAPSILAADFMRLGEQIGIVEANGAEYIHYDVMDGMFVPSISFGMPVLKSVRKGTGLFLDCHLMVVDPYRYIEDFVSSGADSITVHVEACTKTDCRATLELIKEKGIKCGISINPGTHVSALKPYLDLADMVLIMSVEPGFGGQKFIEGTFGKIEELKQLRDEMKLSFDIEVDGGVTADNLADIVRAGVNVIVSGSSIFKGDIEANVKNFKKIIAENACRA